jgi:hypothetical protein
MYLNVKSKKKTQMITEMKVVHIHMDFQTILK